MVVFSHPSKSSLMLMSAPHTLSSTVLDFEGTSQSLGKPALNDLTQVQ